MPDCDGKVIVEFLCIVLREVSLGSSNAPFVGSFIRLQLSCKDTEECCDRLLIGTDESNLVVMTESEADVVKNFHTIDGLGKVLDHKYFVSDLAVRTEVDVRIFTAGRTHVVKLDLFQGTLSGCSLFGFGSVGTESGNKFLQLFDFFLFLFVGFFHLFDEELAGFEPEVVVSGI